MHRVKLANFANFNLAHSKGTYTFSKHTESEIWKEVLSLLSKKATRKVDIPDVDFQHILEINCILNKWLSWK